MDLIHSRSTSGDRLCLVAARVLYVTEHHNDPTMVIIVFDTGATLPTRGNFDSLITALSSTSKVQVG